MKPPTFVMASLALTLAQHAAGAIQYTFSGMIGAISGTDAATLFPGAGPGSAFSITAIIDDDTPPLSSSPTRSLYSSPTLITSLRIEAGSGSATPADLGITQSTDYLIIENDYQIGRAAFLQDQFALLIDDDLSTNRILVSLLSNSLTPPATSLTTPDIPTSSDQLVTSTFQTSTAEIIADDLAISAQIDTVTVVPAPSVPLSIFFCALLGTRRRRA